VQRDETRRREGEAEVLAQQQHRDRVRELLTYRETLKRARLRGDREAEANLVTAIARLEAELNP
jgi:hypothetical protein